MLIWTGWGILAVLIPVLFILGGQPIINSIFSGPRYYSTHFWPRLIACLLGAVIVWFLGRKLNGGKGRVVIDKETGKELHLKHRHTFFFINMEYWAFIIVIIGMILALTNSK